MNVQTKPDLGAAQRPLPFERVALVLQDGGAVGVLDWPRDVKFDRRIDDDRGRKVLWRSHREHFLRRRPCFEEFQWVTLAKRCFSSNF
jgi:hypothetical protein